MLRTPAVSSSMAEAFIQMGKQWEAAGFRVYNIGLFKIHFRNVSAPLPHFIETMIDDGYSDMSKIMKALVEVKFERIVIPDHVPGLGSNQATESAGSEVWRMQ